MSAQMSKSETHILNLPGSNRIEYRLRFTPARIYAVLEATKIITRRRDRRILVRWQNAIHRKISADPRPFTVAHIVEGRPELLALPFFMEGSK